MAAKHQDEIRKPTAEITAGCAMGGLLEMLTRPWTLHILWLLSHNGAMRFGALRRAAEGISARILTLRLRTLEEKGFVSRTVKPTNPPEVTYAPTKRMAEMDGFMAQLHALSDKWKREDIGKYLHAADPIPATQPHSEEHDAAA
ncbi:transcriptional regulator, HxlR family [Bryocella elongata]|uniref:Transcriptional regulator, HxlR family n=1 Tax=Bryocella elongata TaxID=863522 RepID=A0A1H6A6T8_9BACT|nr:helix-turn-helix domain-containing protein [Bryocella elongata]SEG43904.1 transcriptional regulator, HxlR family [Bryocella elongata]